MKPLGYDKPLYMLAFDHRGSFQKNLLGIQGTPTAADRERVGDTKRVPSRSQPATGG